MMFSLLTSTRTETLHKSSLNPYHPLIMVHIHTTPSLCNRNLDICYLYPRNIYKLLRYANMKPSLTLYLNNTFEYMIDEGGSLQSHPAKNLVLQLNLPYILISKII